jgi:uncharacterized protein YqjF (DUF2071 family)
VARFRLSPLLQELVEVIGPARAVILCQAFGGRELYIPITMGPRHRIVRAIGADGAAVLADRYGRNSLVIPFAAARNRAIRNGELAKVAEEKGKSEAGRQFGMHTRSVRRILNSQPRGRDPRQDELF